MRLERFVKLTTGHQTHHTAPVWINPESIATVASAGGYGSPVKVQFIGSPEFMVLDDDRESRYSGTQDSDPEWLDVVLERLYGKWWQR